MAALARKADVRDTPGSQYTKGKCHHGMPNFQNFENANKSWRPADAAYQAPRKDHEGDRCSLARNLVSSNPRYPPMCGNQAAGIDNLSVKLRVIDDTSRPKSIGRSHSEKSRHEVAAVAVVHCPPDFKVKFDV